MREEAPEPRASLLQERVTLVLSLSTTLTLTWAEKQELASDIVIVDLYLLGQEERWLGQESGER